MAEIRLTRVEQGQTKIRNVPIAVTPEGFWCCPSPVVFQKNLKPQNPLNKPKPFSPPHKTAAAAATTTTNSSQKKPNPSNDRKSPFNPSRSASVVTDGQQVHLIPETTDTTPVTANALSVPERVPKPPPKAESLPRKVAIEFGEPRSSDMKLVLLGRQGFCVRLSVHRNVLADHSGFFADKISGLEESGRSCLEINDCEDVEIYVETVGLMYCKELKQRLIKQNVSRVLRILKVAELLGFNACMRACLQYLEAVPWVGEDEEERVVSSVMRLQGETSTAAAAPVLRRVSSGISRPPKDALCQIIDLVLKSHDEKSRRDMKSVVLNLLRENNNSMSAGPADDNINETMYSYCRCSLESLASEFRRGAEAEAARGIALESDNLAWLLEILAGRQAADEFAALWAGQQEIAALHGSVPVVARFHVSAVSARLFVGVGRGELLPPKDTRRLLLQTWLEPLIRDYAWLQHGCRQPFDRKLVEEGIGRTILTLPLDDQQSILLSWLGSFLKAGDNCPNLQRAFEVWWRRTFVRPYVDQQPGDNSLNSD